MTAGELIGLGALAAVGVYVYKTRQAAAAGVPPPAAPPRPPTSFGSFIARGNNPLTVVTGTLANIATHPTDFQESLGLNPRGFVGTFGDVNDFTQLMANAHACQTGNQAACEAVYEQSPDMVCGPSFCDQDPNTNNGHGSARDLGGGSFQYNGSPTQIGLIAHYGKKVPVGGCRTIGRKWDVAGGANASDNIQHGYCAGLS